MSFWDWITGGNAKVVARDIAKLHARTGGNYEEVFLQSVLGIYASFPKGQITQKGIVATKLIFENKIKNYVELAVLILYVSAAPEFQGYQTTYEQFSADMQKYLSTGNIPINLISGDNREITAEIVRAMKERASPL